MRSGRTGEYERGEQPEFAGFRGDMRTEFAGFRADMRTEPRTALADQALALTELIVRQTRTYVLATVGALIALAGLTATLS